MHCHFQGIRSQIYPDVFETKQAEIGCLTDGSNMGDRVMLLSSRTPRFLALNVVSIESLPISLVVSTEMKECCLPVIKLQLI